jgi:hypothetical protein
MEGNDFAVNGRIRGVNSRRGVVGRDATRRPGQHLGDADLAGTLQAAGLLCLLCRGARAAAFPSRGRAAQCCLPRLG